MHLISRALVRPWLRPWLQPWLRPLSFDLFNDFFKRIQERIQVRTLCRATLGGGHIYGRFQQTKGRNVRRIALDAYRGMPHTPTRAPNMTNFTLRTLRAPYIALYDVGGK